jgi:VanZ family protein|tara:strand:- start:6480 stop:6860 length:381 start_codon:yes stop_codon:yes gene_type:complete
MDQKKFIIFYKLIFYLWLSFIFLASSYPGNLINLVLIGDPTTYPGGDKVSHFLAYFILGIFFNLSFKNNSYFKIITFFLILFSLIMELFHMVIPNRFYENFDLLMNFLGLVIGIYILNIYKLFSRT